MTAFTWSERKCVLPNLPPCHFHMSRFHERKKVNEKLAHSVTAYWERE